VDVLDREDEEQDPCHDVFVLASAVVNVNNDDDCRIASSDYNDNNKDND